MIELTKKVQDNDEKFEVFLKKFSDLEVMYHNLIQRDSEL